MRMRLLAGCAAAAALCSAGPQNAASRLEEYMHIKAEARITFLHEAGKIVDRLVLRQHGRDRTVRKVQ